MPADSARSWIRQPEQQVKDLMQLWLPYFMLHSDHARDYIEQDSSSQARLLILIVVYRAFLTA